MAKTVTFKYAPGDEVFIAAPEGIHPGTVHEVMFDEEFEVNVYTLEQYNGAAFRESLLFESVEDLRKNLKYLGDQQ